MKREIGQLAEDEVQRVVESAFGEDFVFRSPKRDDDGNEVTDVLALWDDVALILQAKAQAESPLWRPGRSPVEWSRKHLEKAIKQANGAARTILAGRMSALQNRRRGQIAFTRERFPHLYGLVVIHDDSSPYDAQQLCPDLAKSAVPLQVMGLDDLTAVASVFDTPGDLINYLEHRGDMLVAHLRPKVHEEYRVIEYYLEHLEGLLIARARAMNQELSVSDVTPYANEMRTIARGQHPDFAAGMVIDDVIRQLHDVDDNLRMPGAQFAGGRAHYAEVATELSGVTRPRRIRLGRTLLDLIDKASTSGRDTFRTIRSQRRDQCIMLWASLREPSERAERAQDLAMYTTLAKEYYGLSKAFGIATEGYVGIGRSYDVVLAEFETMPSDEAERLGLAIFGPRDALT